MSQKILVICGSKQVGKTTIGNFVTGYLLRQNEIIRDFGLTEQGDLVVNAQWYENEEVIDGEGILDLSKRDPYHFDYYSKFIWPIVKCYNFAERLKMAIHLIFGINLDILNGTDTQKKYSTHIKWENLFRFMAPMEVKKIRDQKRENNFVSVRELLQRVGTDIFRHIDEDCWVNRVLTDIKNEKPDLAIVTDCRFKSEVKALYNKKNKNTRFILLKDLEGKVGVDKHKSETELLDMPEKYFDLIIDDPKRTMKETTENILYPKLIEWGFVAPLPKEKEEDLIETILDNQAGTTTIFKKED